MILDDIYKRDDLAVAKWAGKRGTFTTFHPETEKTEVFPGTFVNGGEDGLAFQIDRTVVAAREDFFRHSEDYEAHGYLIVALKGTSQHFWLPAEWKVNE